MALFRGSQQWSVLDGPPPPWPRGLDVAAERWARLRPRLRVLMVATGLCGLLILGGVRNSALFAKWGGAGVSVYRATETIPAGQSPVGAVQEVVLPAAAIPDRPAPEIPPGAVLTIPLVSGAVLTETHLTPVGPAAGLTPDERAVTVALDQTSGIEVGVTVDLWTIIDGESGPEPLVSGRPVLAVESSPRPTALISVPASAVRAVAVAVAQGTVLLTISAGGS